MPNYNRGSDDEFNEKKEVGVNCTLFLPSSDETGTDITNFSFSEEANTSEVQFNNGFSQNIAVTGVSFSGSFDIDGNAQDARDEGWDSPGEGTTVPTNVGTLTIKTGTGRLYNFRNVILNSHSKDIPSDDRTSSSFDFMAEGLTVTEE